VKAIDWEDDKPAEDDRVPNKEDAQEIASKTQGPLPGAQQISPMEEAVNKPATEAGGDKEVVQSMSMAPGG
jgi:hypothetical protein